MRIGRRGFLKLVGGLAGAAAVSAVLPAATAVADSVPASAPLFIPADRLAMGVPKPIDRGTIGLWVQDAFGSFQIKIIGGEFQIKIIGGEVQIDQPEIEPDWPFGFKDRRWIPVERTYPLDLKAGYVGLVPADGLILNEIRAKRYLGFEAYRPAPLSVPEQSRSVRDLLAELDRRT